MSKRSLYRDAVIGVAREHGAAIVDEGFTGKGHCYMTVELNGRRRNLFFPGSPSDVRGHKNLRSTARKVIAELRTIT
jgi:hypothetical protein